MTLDDSWPRAVHEASHGFAALQLDATAGAGPVTIEAVRESGGACCWSPPGFPPGDLSRLGAPYPLLPPALRTSIETQVIVALAGDTGERLHAARNGSRTLVAVSAPELPAPLLPAGEQDAADALEAVNALAAVDELVLDTTAVRRLLHDLHGDDRLAEAHRAFLAAETESLLSGPRARRMITSLAEALFWARTLPSQTWISILMAAR